jgi:hypothetical protein
LVKLSWFTDFVNWVVRIYMAETEEQVVTVTVQFPKSEHQEIKIAAIREGITLQDFMRSAALKKVGTVNNGQDAES